MLGKKAKPKIVANKTLDVDASMQGTLTFRDAVNLRINGKFEGTLDTKGNLMIGENAQIQAEIKGETITIAGKVTGNIIATQLLKIMPPAVVMGDMETPILNITEGAIFCGRCQMDVEQSEKRVLSTREVAEYLEVTESTVRDWASSGQIPALKRGKEWNFDKTEIDKWISAKEVKGS